MVYGIFTAGQRTWGGPRADAGQADATTSAQAAIEHAIATGDDLNVVPESFRPALRSQALAHGTNIPHVSLQPSEQFEGRFRSLSRPWDLPFNPTTDDLPLNQPLRRRMTVPLHVPLHPRNSFDSTFSMSSAGQSIYFPRRAESIAALDLDEPSYGAAAAIRARSRSRDQTRSRAHPPSASSARAALRLSQPQFDLPDASARSSYHSRSYNRTSSASSVSSVDLATLNRDSTMLSDHERGRSRPGHVRLASESSSGDLAIDATSSSTNSNMTPGGNKGAGEAIPMVKLTAAASRPASAYLQAGWGVDQHRPPGVRGRHERSSSAARNPFETDSEAESEPDLQLQMPKRTRTGGARSGGSRGLLESSASPAESRSTSGAPATGLSGDNGGARDVGSGVGGLGSATTGADAGSGGAGPSVSASGSGNNRVVVSAKHDKTGGQAQSAPGPGPGSGVATETGTEMGAETEPEKGGKARKKLQNMRKRMFSSGSRSGSRAGDCE